jgi:hypothetical protein
MQVPCRRFRSWAWVPLHPLGLSVSSEVGRWKIADDRPSCRFVQRDRVEQVDG